MNQGPMEDLFSAETTCPQFVPSPTQPARTLQRCIVPGYSREEECVRMYFSYAVHTYIHTFIVRARMYDVCLWKVPRAEDAHSAGSLCRQLAVSRQR